MIQVLYLFMLLFIESTIKFKLLENVKALYRRAKAHVGAWNPEQAKNDYTRAGELDQTLASTVKKHVHDLDEQVKRKAEADKEKLKGLFAS